jgi:hypothetical protein
LDRQSIIAELEGERDRLNKAIAALKSNGRQIKSFGRARSGRHLSAAARKRISEAQKARWAKMKKKE